MPEYGLNIGSRRSVNVITPTFDRDFVTYGTLNHGTGPNITFTRASSATVFTSTGILSTVPDNVPRFEWGSFRTNYIRNSTFAGAVAGNPGTVPSNGWSFQDGNKGISYIIKSVGTDSELGLPYMEVQLSGTNTSGTLASLAIYPLNSNQLQVLSGQTWTTSVYFKTIAGSLPFNSVNLYNFELGSPNGSSITSFTPTTNWQRVSNTRTMSITSEPRYLRPAFAIQSVADGNSIDYTFRIAAPQTELSSAATAFIPTTNAPVTTGVPLGLLIEESRTNLVPTNNIFNWFYNSGNVSVSGGSGFAGLSSYIISDITESVRESAMFDFLSPLLTATPYTVSCYIRKDLTANNFNPLIRIRDTNDNYFGTSFNEALGTWQLGQSGPDSGLTFITNVSTVDLNTHFRHWFTFSVPTTARPYQMQIFGAHGTTTPLPSTGSIEVAGIQVEQGSFPTSYIPTAGLSATRQADIAAVTPVTTFVNQDQGTMLAEYSLPLIISSDKYPRMLSLSNGQDANDIAIYGNNISNNGFINYFNGATDVYLNAGRVVPNTKYSFVGAYRYNDFAASRNGIFLGTDSTASMYGRTLTVFRLGTSGATSHMLNGYLRKVTYWPTRLSNNRLRTLTLSA